MRWGGSRCPWELPAHPGAAGPTPPSKVPVPLPRSPRAPARPAAAEPAVPTEGDGHGGHPCHVG